MTHIKEIVIEHYRSIENIKISFPKNKPVVLFGPNNAGKSNILSAINRLLGERYPTYIELLDSDYYMRDKGKYPTVKITAEFMDRIPLGRTFGNILSVVYGVDGNSASNEFQDVHGAKLYVKQEDRQPCQSVLIDAVRNISNSFAYGNRYSILSKFTHKLHEKLSENERNELNTAFETIKHDFQNNEMYANFVQKLQGNINNAIKGFSHSLDIDFSAYDPNNYANILKIVAKSGDAIHGFEEFGTGEQQILLMAFYKAYMETFVGEDIILIIEEPEAHLHPIAQRWLKEYIQELCKNGMQVIISTHSEHFIDPINIDGLARVYKDNEITKVKQLTTEQLLNYCINSGVPENKVTDASVLQHYAVVCSEEQIKGLFADIVILVEGATEAHALPELFKKHNFSMAEHGIEIVPCYGKQSIALFYRLFSAFGYKCYVIFDFDMDEKATEKAFKGIFDFSTIFMGVEDYTVKEKYAYFSENYEKYFRKNIEHYAAYEENIRREYLIVSKPEIAKAVAKIYLDKVPFISDLINALEDLERKESENEALDNLSLSEKNDEIDDIPF